MDKEVHQLVMLLAMLLGIFSFAAFFHLIDYASRLLRPISLLAHVGAAGMAVTESIYPEAGHDTTEEGEGINLGPPGRVIRHQGASAIVVAVDLDALKALSPAINDPTTAVLAMDQLHRLLRTVGMRQLRTDELLDQSGQLRVIFRTPNWDDFVYLAFSEIRNCGSNNLQIVRRMRAMIENLVQTLPLHRREALLRQLRLLDREVERVFTYPEELALARVADAQGLGGHSGHVTQWKAS